MRGQATDIFETSIWTVAHSHVEFQGAPGDSKNLVVGSSDLKKCVSSDARFRDGCKRFQHCPLSSHPKLVIRGKTINPRRLVPDFSIYPVPTTLPLGFSWAMFL